jgi:hypothetical protein
MERIVCLGPSLRVTKPDRIARAVWTDRIRARRCRLQLPPSQHQQQLVTAPVLQPITDLLVDPMRRRRPRRQRHNENRERSNASVILPHRSGLAAKSVSSRNTRNARN